MNFDLYTPMLEQPKLQGLVLEVFGTGTVSFNKEQFSSFYKALKLATERGVIVMAISQCLKGELDIIRYEASSILLDLKVISGKDLTLEAAVSKMMIGLANFDDIKSALDTSEEEWAAWGAVVTEIGQETFNFLKKVSQDNFLINAKITYNLNSQLIMSFLFENILN